jgi:DNA-binding transcriptional LysR family regulator
MNDPRFTLVQLRYFAAAAEHLSMTTAARQLMVSQSAISTAVAQLERDLGVQLMLRHHARGLTLTAAGESFHQEVKSFLAHGAELAESARAAGATLSGSLSVGCFSTLGPFELPRLLTAYTEAHPSVAIAVQEAEHAALKDLLRQARCEVALMYGYDLDDDIETTLVRVVPPYVLLGERHPLARRKSISLAELADEPMVLLDLPHTAAYMRSVMTSNGVEPQIRHRTAGYETVRALVAHGQGFSILNQQPAHDLTYDGTRVVALRIRDEIAPLNLVVATLKGVRLTARARAFIKTCTSVAGRPGRSAS